MSIPENGIFIVYAPKGSETGLLLITRRHSISLYKCLTINAH